MINRNEILTKAVEDCICEMFKWSQPSIDLKQLVEEGFKDDKENPLFDMHYLSQENFNSIRDIYAEAYGIIDDWDDTFKLIYKQLKEGGMEDDYKPATDKRPGYRGFKRVDPLEKHLKTPEDFDTVLKYIEKIQSFFKGHSRELNNFNMTLFIGCSPTSNKDKVEKYWKKHGRPDFKIKEFDIYDVIYGGVNDEYINITEKEFIDTLK